MEPKAFAAQYIAPCGMNCALCSAFHRKKDTCPGCRSYAGGISRHIDNCVMRNCPTVAQNASGFCYECSEFPCKRLKALDKRYRAKYHASMLGNLAQIRDAGMDALLQSQRKMWTCATCGGVVNIHRGLCLRCGAVKRFGRG